MPSENRAHTLPLFYEICSSQMHDPEQLIQLFNQCFEQTENTILVRGDNEPIYLPADECHSQCRLIFAHGYFASALHEISHWCIAGTERRKLVDFGYWYRPDGRTAEEQKEFEQVEIRPQALEWIFHMASNHSFRISVDNLSGEVSDNSRFKQDVKREVDLMIREGLPRRGEIFTQALLAYYQSELKLVPEQFQLNDL